LVPNDPSSLNGSSMENTRGTLYSVVTGLLMLLFMAVLSGGAALRESVTIDEVSHIASGVSYLQKLDLRLNEEHPPLPKVLAAIPLLLRGLHADYSHISWKVSEDFFPAYMGQWVFGQWLPTKWNNPVATLAWARLPMLLLTLVLGWVLYVYARRLGGTWGGLLCLSIYVSSPTFIAFGPLVHTDIAATLFSLLTLWRFAEVWQNPGRKNAVLFGQSLAGALLSKFTAGILFFAFVAVALSTRWRAVPGQPIGKAEARAWRRVRWRATLQGILWAGLLVYLFYFIFSLNQSSDVLYRLGHGSAWVPLRRLLMPPWLYLRGAFFVVLTGSRPTFILGHAYPHGVWFYFPVLFLLKSPPGFLGLLALALALALWQKRGDEGNSVAIPAELATHWRVLWVSAPNLARLVGATTAALTLSSLLTAVRAYPYYFPYINAFSLGRPAYALVNDSNLDWNQSLPEVKRFADQHGLQRIASDQWAIDDPAATVPQAELWDCQKPTAADDGQWVVVSANMIMDGHNCVRLMQYRHQSLAGGSMFAVQLPEHIPPAGSLGGPPLPSTFRQFGGAPFDMRFFFVDVMRHPETLPQAIQDMMARFKASSKPQSQAPAPSSDK
jgi:hypothetical protein